MLLKDALKFKKIYKPEQKFGIEIEMEGNLLPMPEHIDKIWRIKHDGSLRGNGLEYVFNSPVEYNKALKHIKELYNVFKTFDISPSDRCGVHIHVNMLYNTIEEIFNNIILYLIFEDLLLLYCGEDRIGNTFCLRASDAEWMILQLIKDKKDGVFSRVLDIERFKYGALNLSALSKFGSLEYRALGTPEKADRIICWFNMINRIREYSLSIKDWKGFFFLISRKGTYWLLDEVLGEYATQEMKENNYLLLEGARRIQTLAFTKLKKKENLDIKPFNVTEQVLEELEPLQLAFEEVNTQAPPLQQTTDLTNFYGNFDNTAELASPFSPEAIAVWATEDNRVNDDVNVIVSRWLYNSTVGVLSDGRLIVHYASNPENNGYYYVPLFTVDDLLLNDVVRENS